MKQYNRIMPGAGSRYIDECLEGGFIGVDFIGKEELTEASSGEETVWRQQYLKNIRPNG